MLKRSFSGVADLFITPAKSDIHSAIILNATTAIKDRIDRSVRQSRSSRCLGTLRPSLSPSKYRFPPRESLIRPRSQFIRNPPRARYRPRLEGIRCTPDRGHCAQPGTKATGTNASVGIDCSAPGQTLSLSLPLSLPLHTNIAAVHACRAEQLRERCAERARTPTSRVHIGERGERERERARERETARVSDRESAVRRYRDRDRVVQGRCSTAEVMERQ